jgi:ParB-like chromosome segregation protein Spo0J
MVLPYLDDKLRDLFEEFYEKNPTAEYFLLDGSHKTTAATLSGNKIKVMVFDDEETIQEARRLTEKGVFFNFYLDDTIEGNIETLIRHFQQNSLFQTVQQKTERMVNEKVIPSYMVDYYGNYKWG